MPGPTHFGRYEVRRALGRGGMGAVYEGHDPQIDRAVAIKTIAVDGLNAEETAQFEARFRAETRSAGRLLHPNIVAVYDTGRDDGNAYIVMELVHGQDLRRRLAAGDRPGVDESVAIVRQLLDALAYAHARHVIHRDVKPANLMLQTDGTAKLCDFGVAQLVDPDATRTRGFIVGSVRYSSPEQAAGLPVDARTDLYAAGVVLYELLTGAVPGDPPVPPSRRDPQLPPALDGVVLRALHRDPRERFESAAAFRAALDAAVAPPPAPGAETTRSRRAPLVWGAVGLLAVAVGAGAWLLRPGLRLEGSWTGLYSCGAIVGSQMTSIRTEPFSAPIALDIQGSRVSWTRKGKTSGETVIGRIDELGHFSAEGEGWDDAPGQASRWLVRAEGHYNGAVQPPRLDGHVKLLRSRDRSLARECTMSAVRR